MNWYLYIVKCSDGSFYTGISTDIEKRVKKHNSGNGSKYVRERRPVELVYSETHVNRSDALKREIKIKTFTRAQKLLLIESGD